jgi:cell filamentation protein
VPGYTLEDGITVKNKLGATNHDELDAIEADYVSNRLLQFELGHGPTGEFDAAHLKAIHRYLFQDVYEWAGRTRDEKVRLSDGTVATEPVLRKLDGKPFLPGRRISSALNRLAATLRDANYLRGLPRVEFAYRSADILVVLNAAHPFREGNGRTQRAFIRALAAQAGYDLDFSVVSRERMTQASIAGNEQGNSATMRRMFDEISNPVRALDKAIEALSRRNFPWNDRYIATTEPGYRVEVTMAGMAGDQFMARTIGAVLIGQVSDLPEPRPERGTIFTLRLSSWEMPVSP